MGIGNTKGLSEAKVNKTDKYIIFALCSLLFMPAINNFFNSFLQVGLEIEIGLITPLIYIFMLFCAVFFLYRHIFYKISLVLFCLVLFAGVGISCLIYPEIREILYDSPVDLVYSPINKLVFFCIPAMIGVVRLNDYKKFFSAMKMWSRITLVLGAIVCLYVYVYLERDIQYMSYSYFMLIPICVCYESARAQKIKTDLIFALLGTGCVILCGARGAVVSILLYIIIVWFFLDYQKHILRVALMLILVFLILVYYNEILDMVVDICNRIGVNSRFISALSEGALGESSTRDQITEALFAGVRSNPFGYGFFGDRYVIGTFGYHIYTYSHNIFTEMICDFGIVLGIFLIAALMFRMVKTTLHCKDESFRSVWLALLPYGFIQLLFSSSYLENLAFFMMLGMAFFVKLKKHPKEKM